MFVIYVLKVGAGVSSRLPDWERSFPFRAVPFCTDCLDDISMDCKVHFPGSDLTPQGTALSNILFRTVVLSLVSKDGWR